MNLHYFFLLFLLVLVNSIFYYCPLNSKFIKPKLDLLSSEFEVHYIIYFAFSLVLIFTCQFLTYCVHPYGAK